MQNIDIKIVFTSECKRRNKVFCDMHQLPPRASCGRQQSPCGGASHRWRIHDRDACMHAANKLQGARTYARAYCRPRRGRMQWRCQAFTCNSCSPTAAPQTFHCLTHGLYHELISSGEPASKGARSRCTYVYVTSNCCPEVATMHTVRGMRSYVRTRSISRFHCRRRPIATSCILRVIMATSTRTCHEKSRDPLVTADHVTRHLEAASVQPFEPTASFSVLSPLASI